MNLQGIANRQRLDMAWRPPLQLCIYRMAELLGTPTLGACSLRELEEDVYLWRLHLLVVLPTRPVLSGPFTGHWLCHRDSNLGSARLPSKRHW